MYDINLLPAKLQRKINIDFKRLIILLLIVLGPTGLVVGYTFFLWQLNDLQRDISRIDGQLELMSSRVNQVEQLRRERQMGEQQISALRAVVDNRFTITPILNDIAKNLPVDMWITGISVEYRANAVPRGGFASAPGIPAPEPEVISPGSSVESTTELPPEDTDGNSELPTGAKQPPPPPNILVLQGVSHSTVSIGVLVNNLSRLPYFQNVDLIKVYAATSGVRGQAFHIEAGLRKVDRNVSKP